MIDPGCGSGAWAAVAQWHKETAAAALNPGKTGHEFARKPGEIESPCRHCGATYEEILDAVAPTMCQMAARKERPTPKSFMEDLPSIGDRLREIKKEERRDLPSILERTDGDEILMGLRASMRLTGDAVVQRVLLEWQTPGPC